MEDILITPTKPQTMSTTKGVTVPLNSETDMMTTSLNILFTSSDIQSTNNHINTLSAVQSQEPTIYNQPYPSASVDTVSVFVSPSLSHAQTVASDMTSLLNQQTSSASDSSTNVISSMQSVSVESPAASSLATSVFSNSGTSPSAKVPIISSVKPSSTLLVESSTSAIVFPSGVTSPSIPGETTSSTSSVTEPPKADLTVLFIAIPVCFIVIVVVVAASLYGFNKRKKKKRWTTRPDNRDLWMNPVSDVSLPTNSGSSQTVAPPIQPVIDTTRGISNKSTAELEAKGIKIFKVVYPFEAQLESQISLQTDDVVSVTEQADNGWFRGEVLGHVGWFPSSYVEEIKPPSVLQIAEDERGSKKKSRVTSFLLKKKEKPRRHRKTSKTEHIDDEDDADDSEKDSGVVAEVINMSDIGRTTPVLDGVDGITNSAGKLFKAVFAYKASCKGEISLSEGDFVHCKDRDRNGWMNGLNLRNNDEGWFPAVYVNEASEDDLPAEVTPKPVTYDQLIANKNRDSNLEGIGIEHKALYAYSSSQSEDLLFEAGDNIIVFETLDNGWWLGCKGEGVGWFPGSYVELIDKSDDSSSNASSGLKNFSIFEDYDISSLKSDRSSAITLDGLNESGKINKRDSRSALSVDFKPARKAPAPPPSAKIKKSVESLNENKSKEKPEPPVRYIKPKLVKVPKISTKKLKNLAIIPMPLERPLPPRPPPPKFSNQSKFKKYKSVENSNSTKNSFIQNGSIGLNDTGHKQKPKPPNRTHFVHSSDTKNDQNSLDISLNSNDEPLNNSVGPKIFNRISAHLLDEVQDNTMTPKMAAKLRKVAPPVIPPLLNGDNKENEQTDHNENLDQSVDGYVQEGEKLKNKPPAPKTSPPKANHHASQDSLEIPSQTKKTSLRIAVRSFQALEEGELSFEEGSFIMDIDEGSPRPGWCVGMLNDGTTGIYPITHVGSSRSQLQTEL